MLSNTAKKTEMLQIFDNFSNTRKLIEKNFYGEFNNNFQLRNFPPAEKNRWLNLINNNNS